jgi:hypothetical protein
VSKSRTLEWDYSIDVVENVALLQPLDFMEGASLGQAKLNAEGSLSVLIVAVPPTIPKTLKDVVFTRVNEKDKKP